VNVEQQIYSVLAADSAVAALVGTRIHPILLPQNVIMPAISYQRITTVPQNGLQGHHSIDQVRVQVDSWASTYAGAKSLAAAVRVAMYLTPLFALTVMELDDYDHEEKIYRVIQDFSIWN